MANTYIGLICRTCNAAYPVTLDNDRPERPRLYVGPYALDCVRCDSTERYDDLVLWEEDELIPPYEVAIASRYVRRVPPNAAG